MKTRQRHETYWFADGNVVLATDSTLYRVHKGVLSLQSAFFKDIFELTELHGSSGEVGREANGEEEVMVDGLPVVKMAGDSDEDVEYLIQSIYNPSEWYVVRRSFIHPEFIPIDRQDDSK